jgi:hypothetical protein
MGYNSNPNRKDISGRLDLKNKIRYTRVKERERDEMSHISTA